jgi:hypothetical protein
MSSRLFNRFPLFMAACAALLYGLMAMAAEIESTDQPASGDADPRPTAQPAPPTIARCTVRQDGINWWLVAPTGERFFSLGICMFNQGILPGAYDPQRPSYAAHLQYDAPEAWVDASLKRIKSWGFTTIGGWSDYRLVRSQPAHQDTWLTPVLHLGSTAGAPWFDMWNEKVLNRIHEVAVENIGTLAGDPRVLGYYSDNELGWWNAILWKMTLEQPASSGQRQRLVRVLRDIYNDDWTALAQDFEPQQAANWQELENSGMLWLRPGSNGIHAMRRFLSLVADRYYQVMCDAIQRVDPDAMFLGDRYQSFYYPEVVAASRPYVDIASTNLNANWSDGRFTHSYLDTLHRLTEKPVLVSEFYMAAKENRSGNKNASGHFPKVVTQAERAKGLSTTLHSLLRLPYVVGADWFQYYDEPTHGRILDGEDYNFGLVDIHDQPYEEVTTAFASLRVAEVKAEPATIRRGIAGGVPRAPADPFAGFDSQQAILDWDRQQGFIPASSQHPLGDLYACWSPDALYLAVHMLDIAEPEYYRDGKIPEADRAVWSIRIVGRELVTARLGARIPPAMSDPTIRLESISGAYQQVRCIAVVELPAERFGKKRFAPGDRIELDTSFTTHGRAYRVSWRGPLALLD